MRAFGWLTLGVVLGFSALAPAACLSNNTAAPGADGGQPELDGALPTEDSAAPGTDSNVPETSDDSSVPVTPEGGDDATTPVDAAEAIDAADAAPQAVVLQASSTNVASAGAFTLTVTLNGITATSVEIDDGATAIATLTATPYTKQLELTYLDDGAHTYSAKATLATSGVVTSAPVAVTVAIPANGYFVDPALGSDTANTGTTQTSPFKTIAKAEGLLTADGQSIYLAAGTYDSTTQTSSVFSFAHVTNVLGMGAGASVTVNPSDGTGIGFTFQNGGIVKNVAMSSYYGAILVSNGTFYASNVTFNGVGDAIDITGTAVATIDETGVATPFTSMQAAGLGTITAETGATVTFIGGGGTYDPAALVTTAIFARGHCTLTVSDFTITHCGGSALVLDDNAHVTFDDVTIQTSGASGAGNAAILMGGENTETPSDETLTITGGGITSSPGTALMLSLYGTTPETPTITLSNTHIDSNAGYGLWINGAPTDSALTVTVNATNTTFDSNTDAAIYGPRATLTMTGGTVSNNTAAGIQLTDPASANTLKIRGTAFASNGADSIDFNGLVPTDGAASSVLDLGKTGDPGGIVFTGVGATHTAVSLQTILAGSAIGNTWMPSQQGADATGKYTTSPTTLTTDGENVEVVAGASVTVD